MSEENNDNKLPKELLLYDGSEDKTPVLQTGIIGEISKMDSVLSHVKYDFLKQPLANFSVLSAQVDAICGKNSFLTTKAAFEPLKSTLWADLDKTKESVLGIGKWSADSVCAATTALSSLKESLGASVSALASLEAQTSVLASSLGINPITSVANQISSITGLVSPLSESVRELIAPTTLLSDLSKIALDAHQSMVDAGSLSEWKLGVVDSASYLVDRQVDWTSQFCHSVYGERPFEKIDGFDGISPNVNILSWLPIELEEEKKKKEDIKPKEALEKTTILRLSEKGKRLVNKVVDINNLCLRTGREQLFKYTATTTRAAATMGGTACASRDELGFIIDGLYMFFYENLERIKGLVTDAVVRGEDAFQCIFRVKAMRTDYRHDYEHGADGDIRKKNKMIGSAYAYYSGKPVLTSSQDYLLAQEKLYDEFAELADILEHELMKGVN